MLNPCVRRGGALAGVAALAVGASAQTASNNEAVEALQTLPLQRIDIDSFGRRVDDPSFFVEPLDSSGGAPAPALWWDNGPQDDITAHLSQITSIGEFLAADDFIVKHDLFAYVETLTVCFAVSDTFDGLMNKPVFDLVVYNDCDGRPDTVAYTLPPDPDRVSATLIGPAPWIGFNLWEVTFQVDEFVDGYQRPWVSPRGVGDVQDGLYYWLSANSGLIQGAQGQLKNGAEPWVDVAECNCPTVCTDFYFQIYGHRCCLTKNNVPFDNMGGAKSLQLKGATLDTSRAVDNFQIGPYNQVDFCRIEAWMATNCPLDKIFLEIYSNDCNMPNAKLCTIDMEGYPLVEDTGQDFNGCDIYHLVWNKIDAVPLDPGRDYWLSVVAQGTGSILDKAYWMYLQDLPCNINITEAKVKDVFIPGLEDFTFISEATLGLPRDLAFMVFTREVGQRSEDQEPDSFSPDSGASLVPDDISQQDAGYSAPLPR